MISLSGMRPISQNFFKRLQNSSSVIPSCLNPSFSAAFCRSLALAGRMRLHINILREHTPFFFMLLSNHIEDIEQLSLCLLGSLSPGMTSLNGWHEGYDCAIIIRANKMKL